MPTAPEPVSIPFDDAEGLYANAASVWRSPHDIALDFRVLGPPDDEGERVASAVVRMRLPVTMLPGMLAQLVAEMDRFDEERGRA